jgi:selenide,water dikinase
MIAAGTHACTDITGFGLIGHTTEMAKASGVTVTLYSEALPLLPGVKECAAMGLIPAGAYSNRDYFMDMVHFNESVSPETRAIMYDPQTSGGLLIAVNKNNLDKLLEELGKLGVNNAVVGMAERQKEVAVEVK